MCSNSDTVDQSYVDVVAAGSGMVRSASAIFRVLSVDHLWQALRAVHAHPCGEVFCSCLSQEGLLRSFPSLAPRKPRLVASSSAAAASSSRRGGSGGGDDDGDEDGEYDDDDDDNDDDDE